MENEFMPKELLAATARMVTETVSYLQEVLAYGRSPSEWEWPRMMLYRATDAQDTLGMLVGLYAAHVQRAGHSPDDIARYLQTYQQRPRTQVPQQEDFDYLDGLTDRPARDGASGRYMLGKIAREGCGADNAPQQWTLACIHALGALSGEGEDELESLPPGIGDKARQLYSAMARERV
ncbi:hypothetical protein AGRA3207_007360 [Actinomadura graeca]|uniref:Uncharacterized protein n=1 Tax=Actinomadura graeca TaxID=2750812 RepID=A0ABX8R783_9ACTN|nr:hypothetical protein [Actinomadura graeca]QXJ25807.1 hypothetical protein AGRA3207_007360 [Actinomadura graeca]